MERRHIVQGSLLAITLCTLSLLNPSFALAAATQIPHGTLELVAENQWIPAGHDFHLGLHFQLEQGWHIYWVNPGDSGEPPRVTWHLPVGLAAGPIEWPVPLRLAHSSIVDFGYENSVTLVVPVHVDPSSAPPSTAQLTADVKLLVCREVCIPGKAQLSLSLPVKSQSPAPDAQADTLLVTAQKSLPHVVPANWRFTAHETNDSLILIANLGRQVTQATFFPLVDPQIENAAPQELTPSPHGFRLTLRKSSRLMKPLDHLKGVLALVPDRAYVIDVPLTKPAAASKPAASRTNSRSKIQLVRVS